MASEMIDADERKWGEKTTVYTRRNRKDIRDDKTKAQNITATYTSSENRIDNTADLAATTSSATVSNNNTKKDIHKENDTVAEKSLQTLVTDKASSSQQQQALPAFNEISIQDPADATAPKASVRSNENRAVTILTRVGGRIRINLKSGRPKKEICDVRRKLTDELDQVRSVFKSLVDEEVRLSGQSTASGVGGYGTHSQYSKPFRPLSVAITENENEFGLLGDNERRTVRTNQYYQNSEFLLANDRFSPEMSDMKCNFHGRKKQGRKGGDRVGADKYLSKAFKGCSSLLTRLMKHKHGWLFNEPVDVAALNLQDYHNVIKNPMDFGTIKARLSTHLYKSPIEFAEDVKLTCNNAMTYNPEGNLVYGMAVELLKIFEAKWPAIESDYNLALRYERVQEIGNATSTLRPYDNVDFPIPTLGPRACLTTPTSIQSEFRTLEIPDSTVKLPSELKLQSNRGVGRPPALKKPKAKDLHKRNMTPREKQKLTANLQSLPSEKVNDIVNIMKKRNSALSQHDDEIELDIDSVDVETLWELDRFAINFKKYASKKKRKVELALQAGTGVTRTVSTINAASTTMKSVEHSKIGEKSDAFPSSDQGQHDENSGGSSSSSSSSSSDSNSSSTDSDSDVSSKESEGGGSPRT